MLSRLKMMMMDWRGVAWLALAAVGSVGFMGAALFIACHGGTTTSAPTLTIPQQALLDAASAQAYVVQVARDVGRAHGRGEVGDAQLMEVVRVAEVANGAWRKVARAVAGGSAEGDVEAAREELRRARRALEVTWGAVLAARAATTHGGGGR